MFKAIQSVKLLLRALRAANRCADALESIARDVRDLRDHTLGQQSLAVNRDLDEHDDPRALDGVEISYSDDASTYERELVAASRQGRFGTGRTGPWGI